jgi:hypothetical protein
MRHLARNAHHFLERLSLRVRITSSLDSNLANHGPSMGTRDYTGPETDEGGRTLVRLTAKKPQFGTTGGCGIYLLVVCARQCVPFHARSRKRGPCFVSVQMMGKVMQSEQGKPRMAAEKQSARAVTIGWTVAFRQLEDPRVSLCKASFFKV